jgi:integrase
MAVLIKRRRADGSLSYRVQDRTTGYPSLSETFRTLKAAREFCRKVEAERAEGLAGLRRGRQRLADAVEAFTQTAEFRKRKAAKDTARHLAWWVNQIGQLPLARISPDLIADHLHTLEAGGRTGSTVNRYRSALSRLYRYAITTRHWTDHNPCAMVERRQEGKARERVITPAEWEALLSACGKAEADTKGSKADPTYSPLAQLGNFLRVAYGTAARSGDVRGLRWEYIDLVEKRVTFHNPKTGEGYSVPLVGDALKAIKAQAKIQFEGCPWVFPSPTGSDEHPASFDMPFRVIRKAAGLDGEDAKGERLVIHSLRHSAATEAGKGGATAFEVAAMTNHKTLAMVSRYTKTDEQSALAAMKKRGRA